MYITSVLDVTLFYKQYTDLAQPSIDTVQMGAKLSDLDITINLP